MMMSKTHWIKWKVPWWLYILWVFPHMILWNWNWITRKTSQELRFVYLLLLVSLYDKDLMLQQIVASFIFHYLLIAKYYFVQWLIIWVHYFQPHYRPGQIISSRPICWPRKTKVCVQSRNIPKHSFMFIITSIGQHILTLFILLYYFSGAVV